MTGLPALNLSFLAASPTSRRGGRNLALLLSLLLWTFLALSAARFASVQNTENLVTQIAPLAIVALGQTLVVLTGGLDVSVGAVIGLTCAIVFSPLPLAASLPLAFLAAAAVGAWNGFLVERLAIHPIVATLSSSTMVAGCALLIRPTPGGVVPPLLVALVDARPLGLPAPLFWILAVLAAGHLLLERTRFGLHLFSIGGSPENARLAGVKVVPTIVSTYALSSFFAAVAGLFLAGRIASGDALVGMSFTMDSIAAVALGGAHFTGGIGGVFGTIVGSALLGILSNGMNLLNVSPFLQSIVGGLLLLVAVSFARRKRFGI